MLIEILIVLYLVVTLQAWDGPKLVSCVSALMLAFIWCSIQVLQYMRLDLRVGWQY